MKGKIFLYYTQITVGLQLGYKQLHYLLHPENTWCEQFIKKKKKSRGRKQKTKEKDRMKEKKARWK